MSFGGSIKLSGETAYKQALKQITNSLKEVSAEMKATSTHFADNAKSTDAVKAKSELLNRQMEEQTKKIELLKNRYMELSETEDENSDSMSKLRQQISYAQADINKTANEMEHLGDETKDAGKDAENAASGGWTVFKQVVADLSTKVISAAVDGMKKLGSAIINVGKEAYSEYASYEQLMGGVETLFGDSAKVVQEYAANAYKTAGLSANEYMEQVTSFSATLLQGLDGDTARAAEVADLAIRDMSDNANKMGTSMQSIQNAYQGFAKDNYTMLDNLKLGYGGTAGEMARLINDTKVLGEEVTIVDKDVKNVPFDKIIEAIHIVQTNIGITGTTSKEAASTIEGSTKSVQAAWKNLKVAIADENADLEASIDTLTDNVVTMASNSVPRIKQIVEGLGRGIKTILRKYMPQFANEIIPVVKKVTEWVKGLFNFIQKNGKTIISILKGIVAAFVAFKAAQAISSVISLFTTLFSAIKTGTGIVAAFNGVMAANPILAVAAAVAGLITVIVSLTKATNEDTEAQAKHKAEIDELCESVDRNVESWDDLKEAQQGYYNKAMSELSYYERLWKELQSIVDENGVVQKGYETRASFIANELSEAFGIEIKLVDGTIQKYGELKDSIQKVLEKEKAQALLSKQKALYEEAITNQASAYKDLVKVESEYLAYKEKEKALTEDIERLKEKTGQRPDDPEFKLLLAKTQQLEKLREENAGLETSYNNLDRTVKEYAFNIAQYENNLMLAHEENYDAMTNKEFEYIGASEDVVEAKKRQMQEEITATERHLQDLYDMQEQAQDDRYQSQIEAEEESLKEQKAAFARYNVATKLGLDENELLWNTSLTNTLSEITGHNVAFKRGANGNIDMYIDGMLERRTDSETAMLEIVNGMLDEAAKQEPEAKDEGKAIGENIVEGVGAGVSNQQKQEGVFWKLGQFCANVLQRIRDGLQEKSPSKATAEMGINLLKGVTVGITKETPGTLRAVGAFGQSVVDALNDEMSGASLQIPLIESQNKSIWRGIGSATQTAKRVSAVESSGNMVDAFKEALSEMKIVLDDEVAGRFVEDTVARAIYA